MDVTMDVLSDVILLLLNKAGENGLTKTQIIKLVFFVDLEAAKRIGMPLTDCDYKTYTYGVVDFSVWDKVNALAKKNIGLKIHSYPTGFGNDSYKAVLDPNTVDLEGVSQLVNDIVEAVWFEYGSFSASKLGGITKQLVPMDDEWEINIPVDVRDIAYEQSEEFAEMVRRSKDPNNYGEAMTYEEFMQYLENEYKSIPTE